MATPAPPQVHPAERDNSIIVLKICGIILTVCAVGAVSAVLRTVIPPLLLGLLLYFLVVPVIEYLDTRRVPRWLTYVFLCVMGAGAVFGAWRVIENQGQELTARVPQYRQRLHQALNPYVQTLGLKKKEDNSESSKGDEAGKSQSPKKKPDAKPDTEPGTVEDAVPVSQDELVRYGFETAIGLLELSTMAFFYLLFALVESRHMERRMRRSLSSETASRIKSVIDSLKADMRSFLWIKTLVSAGLGVTTAALGWAFGLDFWLMWGCLMFLSNYITYIGSMVALVPMVLVAVAQFESMPAAAGLSTLLILNRLIWIDYAEMRYSGKYVDVSPLLILFSVALMGWIWGVVGMLLAVPLITTVRTALDSFPRTKFLARLISDEEQK